MTMSRQSGLSLVELLIATAVGLILILGVAKLFVGSNDNFRLAGAVSRMQESGRMAHEILGRAIRNADYWGCAKHENVSVSGAIGAGEFLAFEESDGASVTVTTSDGSANVVNGSSIIRIKTSRGTGVRLTDKMGNSGEDIQIPDGDEAPFAGTIEAGDNLLVADCLEGSVFQVSSVSSSGAESVALQHGDALSKPYLNGEILVPEIIEYRVEQSGDRYTLVRETVSGQDELINGVRDMRVQLGIGDTDKRTVDKWSDDPADVGVNEEIKALRVSLLVRSPEGGVRSNDAGAQKVCFPEWNCGSASVPANDNDHLYRVYTSTYSVRNRLMGGS